MKKIVLIMIGCLLINILWMNTEAVYKEDVNDIAVIGYHHIAKHEDKQKYFRYDPWTQDLDDFKEQMQYLYDHGYKTITLDELNEWYEGKRKIDNKTVVLTFDDSYYSTYTIAKPILKQYGFSATCFVVGKSIAKEQVYDGSRKQHIPLSLLKDDETLQFYSHFYNLHRRIDGEFAIHTYSYNAIKEDIHKASQTVSTKYLAYPYGKTNDVALKAIEDSDTTMAFRYHQYYKMSREDPRYALPRFSVHGFTPMFMFRYYINQ